jgi:hypothetical protein
MNDFIAQTDNKRQIFDVFDEIARIPDSSDTMLADVYFSDHPSASSRIFRIFRTLPLHYHTEPGSTGGIGGGQLLKGRIKTAWKWVRVSCWPGLPVCPRVCGRGYGKGVEGARLFLGGSGGRSPVCCVKGVAPFVFEGPVFGYRRTIVGRRNDLFNLTPNSRRRPLTIRYVPRLMLRLP